jgi:hypothetical protein
MQPSEHSWTTAVFAAAMMAAASVHAELSAEALAKIAPNPVG